MREAVAVAVAVGWSGGEGWLGRVGGWEGFWGERTGGVEPGLEGAGEAAFVGGGAVGGGEGAEAAGEVWEGLVWGCLFFWGKRVR